MVEKNNNYVNKYWQINPDSPKTQKLHRTKTLINQKIEERDRTKRVSVLIDLDQYYWSISVKYTSRFPVRRTETRNTHVFPLRFLFLSPLLPFRFRFLLYLFVVYLYCFVVSPFVCFCSIFFNSLCIPRFLLWIGFPVLFGSLCIFAPFSVFFICFHGLPSTPHVIFFVGLNFFCSTVLPS